MKHGVTSKPFISHKMPRTVKLLCLANSHKEKNRCVAGLDLESGDWIRPVSNFGDGSLHPRHYLTKDGHDPDPLDIIRLSLDEPQPEPYQPENWIITDEDWVRCGSEIGDQEARVLFEAIHAGSNLLRNDRTKINYSEIEQSPIDQSLALVRPEMPHFKIRERDGRGDQPRANFELQGTEYDLPITDPDWKKRIKSTEILPDMNLKCEPASAYADDDKRLLFTISISTPHNGACYKLVAGIVPVPPAVIDHIDSK